MLLPDLVPAAEALEVAALTPTNAWQETPGPLRFGVFVYCRFNSVCTFSNRPSGESPGSQGKGPSRSAASRVPSSTSTNASPGAEQVWTELLQPSPELLQLEPWTEYPPETERGLRQAVDVSGKSKGPSFRRSDQKQLCNDKNHLHCAAMQQHQPLFGHQDDVIQIIRHRIAISPAFLIDLNSFQSGIIQLIQHHWQEGSRQHLLQLHPEIEKAQALKKIENQETICQKFQKELGNYE